MNKTDWAATAVFVIGLALIIAAAVADCYVPCATYRSMRAKDVPARCLREFVQP